MSDSALCVEEADVDEGAWGEAGLDWGGEDDFWFACFPAFVILDIPCMFAH